MTTNNYAPSWNWNNDGETLTGTIQEMRKVESKFDPGRLVTVVDLVLESGETRAVWCDSYGLRRFIEVSMPRPGDRVLLRRAGKKEFQTKSGETRSMWEWETEILPTTESGMPVTPVAPEPVTSDDIPF